MKMSTTILWNMPIIYAHCSNKLTLKKKCIHLLLFKFIVMLIDSKIKHIVSIWYSKKVRIWTCLFSKNVIFYNFLLKFELVFKFKIYQLLWKHRMLQNVCNSLYRKEDARLQRAKVLILSFKHNLLAKILLLHKDCF